MSDRPDFSDARSFPVKFHEIEIYPDDDSSINHLYTGTIVIAK